MEQDVYEDAKRAVMAYVADPDEVPEMCFPEMRRWLLEGPANHPPEGTADWLRDREELWDRASRVVEAMDAAMPGIDGPFPEWFGSRAAMIAKMPWAAELGWAVDEMERMLAG